MYSEKAWITGLGTPEDADAVEAALPDFLGGGQPGFGLRWSIYSATHPAFFTGVEGAFARGQIVLGVFDHVQGCNKVAAVAIGHLIATVGHEPISIGTSPRAHAIAHQKVIVQNLALTDEQRAMQAALPDFQDWREALKAGQAVTWSGSWNVDLAADKQINNVDIIASPTRAAQFGAMVQYHHDWIRQNEPNYQRAVQSLFLRAPYRAASFSVAH